ncbi:MAG: hypothetical protein ACI8WT_004783, partial [Clostridium sp.]
SMETVSSLEIDVDTVYLRSNVIRVESEDFDYWEYDEIQYTKDEYIQLLSEQLMSKK